MQNLQQEQGITKVYFIYRVILSITLSSLFFVDDTVGIAGNYHNHTYLIVIIIYALFSLAGLIFAHKKGFLPRKSFISGTVFSDIITTGVLVHVSGGFSTGLGILLLTPVAAAGIFFYGIGATAAAALATLTIIFETLFSTLQDPLYSKYIVPSGLYGIVLFVASGIIQLLSKYIRSTQKELQKQRGEVYSLEQLNQQIVQRLRTGILILDKEKKIKMLNQAALALLDNHLKENTIMKGEAANRFDAWIKDPSTKLESFQQAPEKNEVRINFSRINYQDGETDYIVFVENKTELVQQAQQMKLASLGRLSASIAHEIRNPLNAISHATQLLKENEQLDPQDMRLLEIIENHTRRLNNIVSNTLSISRRSTPMPEKIVLPEFLQEVKTQIQQSFGENINFNIHLSNPDIIIAFDRSQLNQVMINLIENALRYSHKATGEYWVMLKGYIDEKLEIPILNILDHGAGINAEDAEKVFEPFYTTDAQGTGLGLYICKELCELNQAELEYVIKPGEKGFFQIRFSHPDKRIISS